MPPKYNRRPKNSLRKGQVDPLEVKTVLSKALQQFGISKDIARYSFVLHWKEIVGEELAKRTHPECIRQNRLVIRVLESSWAQELSFHKEHILKRLRPYLDDGVVVDDVSFYVAGELPERGGVQEKRVGNG